jgi:hypothetical protein
MRLLPSPRHLVLTLAATLLASACGQEPTTVVRPSLRSDALSRNEVPRPPGYVGTLWFCKVGPSSATGESYTVQVTATGGSFVFLSGNTTDNLVTRVVFDGAGVCQAGSGGAALYYVKDGSTIHISVQEVLPTGNGSTPQSWALVFDNGTQDVITTAGAVNPFSFDLHTSDTFDYKLTLTNGNPPPPSVCTDQNALNFGGPLPCVYPPPPPPPGNGCTPGYWKVDQHWDSWPSPYVPSAKIKTYFPKASLYTLSGTAMGNYTLVQGLNFQGGNDLAGAAQILLRAGIAGLLNSAKGFTPAYPMTTSSLLTQVNNALASGDRTTMINLANTIDGNNNLGCPLN